MLGPMGVGVLWVHPDRLREMPAYHVGSNMAHGVDLGSATLEPGAFRFQAGTPNVSGPVALAAAIDLLDQVTFDVIAEHDRALSAHAMQRLQAVPGLRLFGTAGPDRRAPVFSFALAGVPVPRIVEAADGAGIAVRGGDLAALPLLRRFGVETAARASAYIYNTIEEFDRLADLLTTLAATARR
jgi:cysteine desulfurase/selenocysteine lyase